MCVCVCVCVHNNSKSNGSIHLKLKHCVVYEDSLDEFDFGHCLIKVKVTVSRSRSQLRHMLGSCDLVCIYVNQIIIYKIY